TGVARYSPCRRASDWSCRAWYSSIGWIHLSQNDLLGIDAIANPELWPVTVRWLFQTDRGAPLAICSCHRLSFPEPAVEPDCKGPRRGFRKGAPHAPDAVDMAERRPGM